MRALMRALHKPIYDSRQRVLVARILRHLRPYDRLLDVGCGSGLLAHAIASDPACPAGVQVEGLERYPRSGEPIRVTGYAGGPFPFADNTFDLVVIADVLHHEPDPHALLDQCARVSKRLLIIKDHQVKGPLAQQRIGLIDWAANVGYGVKCLFTYNTPAQWQAEIQRLKLTPIEQPPGLDLYPWGLDLLFGGSIQFFCVLEKPA
jgi:SAM-dependent methyltransferase